MKLYKDKTKILMLTHYAFRAEDGEDTDQRILRYLKERVRKVVLITHPFPDFNYRTSYCTIYENGNQVKQIKVAIVKGLSALQYLHHVLLIYYYLVRVGLSYDLCIALENMSFMVILPFRLLGTVKRLVYYSIDFMPQRFPNPFINWLYHFIDKLACRLSDINWVMVKEQINERRKYGAITIKSSAFTIVPIGYETKNIDIKPLNKIDFHNIVYAGGFRESMGPQLVIKAMPHLITKIPDIRLTIIGLGKDLKKLKSLIKELKVSQQVDFKGFIPGFRDLTHEISLKSIALAPYAPIPGSYSYYSDPSKIKLYICCGVPVITTKVTTISNLISKTHSGIIIDYSEKALYKAVLFLLASKKRFLNYKNAAIDLSHKFDINHIMDNAIQKIPF